MAGEKLYEATPSHLESARRQGDVAKSAELCAIAAFAVGLAALAVELPALHSTFARVIILAAQGSTVNAALLHACALSVAPLFMAGGAAMLCAAVQTGGVTFVPLGFRCERLSPAANLRRILSRESLLSAVRAIAAFSSITIAIAPAVRRVVGQAEASYAPSATASSVWSSALQAAAAACSIAALFAIADYGFQVAQRKRRLRMSADEYKRDRKEHDGDPFMRGRRRTQHRRIASGSLRRVKDAAFVVCNPTHIAVALEYRPPAVEVPRVLVRAADEIALRAREIATRERIPIVENKLVARELYDAAQPGQYIPHALYVAVAQIVAALKLQA